MNLPIYSIEFDKVLKNIHNYVDRYVCFKNIDGSAISDINDSRKKVKKVFFGENEPLVTQKKYLYG